MDFSVILQSPQVRAIVQDGYLERAYHESLFPNLLFRGEATPKQFAGNVGDSAFFTGKGLIQPKTRRLVPGQDPVPSNYQFEQWFAQLGLYADTIDTNMPTSVVAAANLFISNAQQLGLGAGQSLNRAVRDAMYNAACSGHTVTSSATGSGGTSVPVQRLQGLTRARRPDLAAGSPVRFDPVSTSNPLSVTVMNSATPQVVNITGFTPTYSGDETGPGSITVDSAVTFQSRSAVFASDKSFIVRSIAGNSIDAITAGSFFTLALWRSALSHLQSQNVPPFDDGYFHVHLDPTSQGQIFADAEFQRLQQSLPDYYPYKNFALGIFLGAVPFRNNEAPSAAGANVTLASDGITYTPDETFAPELYATGVTTGPVIHRPIFVGQGGIHEYYTDLDEMITEAGLNGVAGTARIVNNGIDVMTERIQMIIRGPLDRLQQNVSTSWKFIGDFPARTDAATGDKARYKRFLVVEHSE
jgi:hypothetical protein